MQVMLPEASLPAILKLNADFPMNDEQFHALCVANPDVRIERSSQGEIVIVPPAGAESDYRNLGLAADLRQWARREGKGKAFGPTVEFFLPGGAAYSPDASWVSNKRLASLNKEQLRGFPHLVPEFIAEVMSPSDRLKRAKAKMDEWMANGVELGWLIDGDNKAVYIYRQGQEPEKITGAGEVAGEGPIAGFVLDMTEIWAGL